MREEEQLSTEVERGVYRDLSAYDPLFRFPNDSELRTPIVEDNVNDEAISYFAKAAAAAKAHIVQGFHGLEGGFELLSLAFDTSSASSSLTEPSGCMQACGWWAARLNPSSSRQVIGSDAPKSSSSATMAPRLMMSSR